MGLLDRIGAFDRYKVSPTQGTSGLLTGAQQPMSPFAQQAARNIGGLLGMDMRTPQEKMQQELKQVKDPLSPEGLLQRAQIISANSNDPKAIQVAAALAAEGRRLKTAQTTKERATQARESSAEWLEENAPELSDLHDNFALADEAVAKMAENQVVREAAERLETAGKKPARRGKIAVAKTFNLPKEDEERLIRQINNGDFDEQSVQDLEDNFDVSLVEATPKNYIVFNDINDPSKGTNRVALRTDKYGRVHNGTEFVSLRQAGVKEEAGVGKEATEPEAPTTRETLRTTAAGSVKNFAKQLSGLSGTGERGAVLALVESPTARMVGGVFDSDAAKRANQIKIAKDAIAQSVGRDLSGGQIKEQEMKDFRVQLVPTFTDFTDNDAIFTKLVNTSLGLSIAADTALDRGAKANEQGVVPFTGQELNQALAKIAATPITPEIQKLVDEGKFDEAIEARVNQVLGRSSQEESREERLARIKAKY